MLHNIEKILLLKLDLILYKFWKVSEKIRGWHFVFNAIWRLHAIFNLNSWKILILRYIAYFHWIEASNRLEWLGGGGEFTPHSPHPHRWIGAKHGSEIHSPYTPRFQFQTKFQTTPTSLGCIVQASKISIKFLGNMHCQRNIHTTLKRCRFITKHPKCTLHYLEIISHETLTIFKSFSIFLRTEVSKSYSSGSLYSNIVHSSLF